MRNFAAGAGDSVAADFAGKILLPYPAEINVGKVMIANNAIRHAVELRRWAAYRPPFDGFTTPQTRQGKPQAAWNGKPCG